MIYFFEYTYGTNIDKEWILKLSSFLHLVVRKESGYLKDGLWSSNEMQEHGGQWLLYEWQSQINKITSHFSESLNIYLH